MWSWACWVLYSILCVLCGLLTSTYGVAVIALSGLTHYHMLDDEDIAKSAQNGQDVPQQATMKKKSKKKDDGWSDKGSKLGRFRIEPFHAITRKYFKDFDELFTFLSMGFAVLLTCTLLNTFAGEEFKAGGMSGDLAALLLGAMVTWKLIGCMSRVQFEKSASSAMDAQISVFVGIICGFLSLAILTITPAGAIDFSFESSIKEAEKSITAHLNFKLKENVKPYPPLQIPQVFFSVAISAMAGSIGTLLLPASLRLTRCYHLAIAPDEKSLSVVQNGFWTLFLLHVNFVLPIFIPFLWVKPMASLFATESTPVPSGGSTSMSLGISQEAFSQVRLCLLSFWALLHLASFRFHIQSYLNSAIMSWYKELHGNMEPRIESIKSRLGAMTNHLCKVAMHCVFPGALVLLLIGLMVTRGHHLDGRAIENGILFPPAMLRQSFEYLAWCTCSLWAFQSVIALTLFKVGYLQSV